MVFFTLELSRYMTDLAPLIMVWTNFIGTGSEGGAYSVVACLSRMTTDHASLARRSTVPTPDSDTFNI